MLATAARAKVLACHEDASRVSRIIKHEVLVGCSVCIVTPVTKQIVTEETLLACRSLEESGRYDLVCIYVLQRQGDASRCNDIEFLFHNSVLGSVITPVTAAAAATSGDANMVREPGP